MSDVHPVLVAGEWRAATSSGSFRGENPATGEALPDLFPISAWSDCDAAIAAGSPVIAKANSSHPNTTRLLGEEAFAALLDSDLHPSTVQLLYRTSHDDGARAVADPRTGATGYTGSRGAGLTLKAAAD